MAKRKWGEGSFWEKEYPNGRRVHVYQFSHQGESYQRVLGDVGVAKPRQLDRLAREAKAKKIAEVASGQGKTRVSSDGQSRTLRAVCDRHVDLVRRDERKASTVERYQEIIDVHICQHFKSGMAIDKITPKQIEAFIDYLFDEKKLSSGTAENIVNLLGRILRTAKVSEDVMRDVEGKPKAKQDNRIRFLTMTEVEKLLDAVPAGEFNSTERTLYIVAAMTGLRLGELRALRWRNVDFNLGKIHVEETFSDGRLTAPKSKMSLRSIPMAPRVSQALAQHANASAYDSPGDLVFPHPHKGTYLGDTTIRTRFKQARDAAGVRPVRFHDLRHTFATTMASAGTPLVALQVMMGHSTYEMTLKYAKWAPGKGSVEMGFVTNAFPEIADELLMAPAHMQS